MTQNVSRISEHARRAEGIVKGMLAHSAGGFTEAPQSTDLNRVVSTAVEQVMLEWHGGGNPPVEVQSSYDPHLPPVEILVKDVSRVFVNLLQNAPDALEEKRLVAGREFKPLIEVTTRDTHSHVEVSVRDNGTGISPEHLDKIFAPFFTTRAGRTVASGGGASGVARHGTGLGLSLSYDVIVFGHGGELRVDSEPGQYAEFVVRLPKSSG